MQKNYDDLRHEAAALAREIQAVEMQLELEQCYFDDQITDHENWLEAKNKEETFYTQELQVVECYYEDLIADYEHWMDEIHMHSDFNSFTTYVNDDDMDNLLQHIHAIEEHLKYEDDDNMETEWQHLHSKEENLRKDLLLASCNFSLTDISKNKTIEDTRDVGMWLPTVKETEERHNFDYNCQPTIYKYTYQAEHITDQVMYTTGYTYHSLGVKQMSLVVQESAYQPVIQMETTVNETEDALQQKKDSFNSLSCRKRHQMKSSRQECLSLKKIYFRRIFSRYSLKCFILRKH